MAKELEAKSDFSDQPYIYICNKVIIVIIYLKQSKTYFNPTLRCWKTLYTHHKIFYNLTDPAEFTLITSAACPPRLQQCPLEPIVGLRNIWEPPHLAISNPDYSSNRPRRFITSSPLHCGLTWTSNNHHIISIILY